MVDHQRMVQAVLVAGKRLGTGFGVVMVEAVAELAGEGGKGGGMMQHAGGAAGGQGMGPRLAIITRVRVRPRQKGRESGAEVPDWSHSRRLVGGMGAGTHRLVGGG